MLMNIDKFQCQPKIPFFWEDTRLPTAFCDLSRKSCHIFRKCNTECCINFLKVTSCQDCKEKSISSFQLEAA